MALLRQAGLETGWRDEASLVSHFPAHVWDATEREWRKLQGRAGTAASRKPESYYRRLHAGSGSAEARGAKQFGQTGTEGSDREGHVRLSGSNWIMKENGGISEVLYFVGVPDGI